MDKLRTYDEMVSILTLPCFFVNSCPSLLTLINSLLPFGNASIFNSPWRGKNCANRFSKDSTWMLNLTPDGLVTFLARHKIG